MSKNKVKPETIHNMNKNTTRQIKRRRAQKKRQLWHVACDPLRRAGELRKGSWEASSRWLLCLPVCRLQVECSLPLLLSKRGVPLPLVFSLWGNGGPNGPKTKWGTVARGTKTACFGTTHKQHAHTLIPHYRHSWTCLHQCDMWTQSGRSEGNHSPLNYDLVCEMMNLVGDQFVKRGSHWALDHLMGHHLKDNSIVLSLLTFKSNQTGQHCGPT